MFDKSVVPKYRFVENRSSSDSRSVFEMKHKTADEFAQDVADVYTRIQTLGGRVVFNELIALGISCPGNDRDYVFGRANFGVTDEHFILVADIPE
jgi:hypothetical protein